MMMPPRRICGNTTSGMNCTGLELRARERAGEEGRGGAEDRIEDGDEAQRHSGPSTSRPHTHTAKPTVMSACRTAAAPNARA